MVVRKTLIVVILVIVLLVVAIGGYIWLTGAPPSGAAPTVTSTSPANAATGVPVSTRVLATFSKAMNPSTITASTFTLKQGATAVSGLVSYAGTTATLDPASDLAASTVYTATITTGAKDPSGRALAANVVWSFTTGQVPDTAPPRVSFTSPANAATGVAVNAKVLASFSKAMDATTITASTFTLKQGATSVSGTVSYAGTTATLDPASDLAASTVYTATITTGAKDSSGLALVANFVWTFTTGVVPDATAPRVTFTSPANAATGVAVNTKVLASFNEAMDPLTITASTFTLKRGATSVSGTVGYAGVTATFAPSSDLAASTVYTATITTGAKDLAGNALAANFVWTFTTGQVPDTTPPVVTFTSPAFGATGVSVNTKVLATFSEAMDPLTITTSTFTVRAKDDVGLGTVSYAGLTATFAPSNNLLASTKYTATITTGAKDLAGNALQNNFVWTFTTDPTLDTTPPRVVSTSPVLAVPVDSDISATFSEAMDPLTITTSTFFVEQGVTPVSGLVSYAGLTATFDPASNLAPNTTYTATITTGVRDLAGNAMRRDFIWSFTTSTAPPACSQLPVVLGAAGAFAVLAGSTVANTGSSIVTGDVGVSPGTAIIGFPPGTVIGAIHAADPTAAAGIADLTTAYNDAAGRTLCPITVSGNIGGQTLAPGLYKSTSSLEITSGDLTLDAQGDPNAVWIFQIASTLTTTAGRQVILAGGAKASNVFWQVGTSATIGTNSVFVGTIMADQSVTLITGATLDGRALARIAAATLDNNIITVPAP